MCRAEVTGTVKITQPVTVNRTHRVPLSGLGSADGRSFRSNDKEEEQCAGGFTSQSNRMSRW